MVLFTIENLITTAGGILYFILLIVGIIFVLTFALKIAIGGVKGENREFGNVFITGIIMIFISVLITYVIYLFLPTMAYIGSIAGLIIEIFVIKIRHETNILGGLGALLLYVIVLIGLIFIINLFIPGLAIIGLDILGLTPYISIP